MKAKEDDMVRGVKAVMELSDQYGDAIKVLKNVLDSTGKAFDSGDNSPQIAWEEYTYAIWGVLADSQDAMNEAADLLAQYTREIYDVDGANADALKEAGDMEDAIRPEGDK